MRIPRICLCLITNMYMGLNDGVFFPLAMLCNVNFREMANTGRLIIIIKSNQANQGSCPVY